MMNTILAQARPGSRPSRSISRRVALVASIAGALVATSGLLLLVVLGGSIELGSAVSYLGWLGCIGFLLVRRRWTPFVSAALSTLILGLLVNQPYATGSLLNPSGNYGHFAGVMIVIICVLLALGGSLGAAAREYRNLSE